MGLNRGSKRALNFVHLLVVIIIISLVQEPWLYKTKIIGLRGCGQLICGRVDNSRACLLVKGLRVEAIPKYCLRDLATAKFWYKDDKGGMREVVVASAYFPYESNLCPTAEVIELIKFCEDKGWDLLLGCDANAHHLAWGSSDTNNMGEKLLPPTLTS